MAGKQSRILTLAVRQDQICAIFFQGGELYSWEASRKGAENTQEAIAKFRIWAHVYQPDLIICEDPSAAERKGRKNANILKSLARAANDHVALNALVPRSQQYKNIYEEAQALVQRFPEMKPHLKSRPPIWKNEPRDMIYFEALSLTLHILDSIGRP